MADSWAHTWISIVTIIFTLLLVITYPDFFTSDTIFWILVGLVGIHALFTSDNDSIYGGDLEHEHIEHEHIEHEHVVGGIDESTDSTYLKMSLMDPKHNIREIAKQLILLEDHMAHPPKRCIDCITKHYLMVEGLLEEAITLDKAGEHTEEIREITNKIKPTMLRIIDLIKNNGINDSEYHIACQTVREVRKKIALKYVLNT